MDGKDTAKKAWKKTGFGILFVAACFAVMYILMEFHSDILMVSIAAALLLITAFLFLNAVFSDKAKKSISGGEEKEILSSGNDGEFRLMLTKHMKEMEGTQKELIEVLKNQNTLIQTQIDNLEHEIYMLSEKQVNQAKSIIKFNKENARQLAISERETLEYVMAELKKAIEDNAEPAAGEETVELLSKEDTIKEEPAAPENYKEPAAKALEELDETELFEVSELQGDDEFVIPEMPEDIDLSELFDIPEPHEESAEEVVSTEENPAVEVIEENPAAEEKEKEPEPETPVSDPLAGFGSDPNAMMTPEDIAKLLEAMGQ